MARNVTHQGLSAGNIIFLYRVLRDGIGTGKQTFITRVEEVLAADRLGAEDLGFDSTQQLLEQMGDCIKLTVFKGGRIYATVVSQPSWDEALATSDKGIDKKAQGKGNKPWKKKKGDKALKPVCPKRVKREAPRENAAPPADSVTASASAPVSEPASEGSVGINAMDAARAEHPTANEHAESPIIRNARFSLDDPKALDVESSDLTNRQDANTAGVPPIPAGDSVISEPIAPETPGISLTVTYNPYTGEEQETVLKASPAKAAKVHEPQRDHCDPEAALEPKTHETADPRDAAHGITDAAATRGRAKQDPQGERPPRCENAVEQARPADEAKGDPIPLIEPPVPAAPDDLDAPTSCDSGSAIPSDSNAAASDTTPTTLQVSDMPQDNAPESSIAQVQMAVPANPEPAVQLPNDLPVDFATDVYCPGDLLHQLTLLYPYGADVLGILGEYFHIDCDRGSIEATRRRATFTARFVEDGERKDVRVRIIRRDEHGMGPKWAIDRLITPTE